MFGELYDGTPIHGVDFVRVVPPRGPILWWPLNGSHTYFNRVILKWYAVKYNACYQVQVDNNTDFSSPEQNVTVVHNTYYTTAPLYRGTYYWRVRVGGDCDVTEGPWSEVWRFTIK
jgi:hypothetical protein